MELVDRAIPFRELTGAWRAAAAAGCFLLIAGEAGIGKTALVEQFVCQHEPRARILRGACDALFTPRPLGPIHDIAQENGGELTRLLAEDASPPQLFAAFLAELQAEPAIVVVEDIHWADEATLDLLKYLGRRIHQTRSFLISTFRDDELGPQHPLRLLLGDLATSPAVRRLSLTPLTIEGVHELIARRPFDAESLHRQTGGNPFYVTEVLAAGQDEVPPTIRDAVLARAARLSLSGRAVLHAAAVIGPRIEPWLLAAVTRAEASAVNESLDSGMLQAQGNLLVFRHELARLVILETIPPHQRLFLHRAVLDELKASRLTQHDVTRLAHHAAAADDREMILTYARAAGKDAAASGMQRAAAAQFALALRYVDELPVLEQIELYEAYGMSRQAEPDRQATIAAYRRAAELAQEAGLPLYQGSVLARLATCLEMTDENQQAERTLQQALAILEPLGPSVGLANAYKEMAYLYLKRGERKAAVTYAEKSLDMAQLTEETKLIINMRQMLGLCWLPLDHRRGCGFLEESLALALEHDDFWTAGSLYANLMMTWVDVYNLLRAGELVAAGIAFTGEHDIDTARQVLEGWQSMLDLYRGHWPEALAGAQELLSRPNIHPFALTPARLAAGRVLVRRGEPGGDDLLDDALAGLLKTANRQRVPTAYTARAEAAWLAGDPERTVAEANAAYELALQNQQPGFAAELAYWLWQSGEAVETHDWMVRPFVLEIQGNWRAAAALWEKLGCPYEQARALAQGNSEAQKEALLIFEQLGARPMAERVRAQLRAAGVQTIPRGPRAATRQNPFGLTNRQVEILALLAENLTNAEIAARLHLSPKTVDHHVSAVLAKLDVASRDQAAHLARQHPDFSTST